MNNEQRIAELERIVREQQKFINDLQFSHSIPLGIDQSFRERLLKNSGMLVPTGVGSAGGTSVYNSFDVIVPANPSGTLKVPFNGVTYELLYK